MTDQNHRNLIDALQSVKTATTKVAKQEAMKSHEDTLWFKEALKFLLNPFDLIGISTKKAMKNVEPIELTHDFHQILEYLRSNPTGNDENIATLQGYLNQFDTDDRAFMVTLITKTLSLGVSAKSANKAFSDLNISTFDVQLAFPYEKKIQSYSDKDLFYFTQKLDGHRALTTVEPHENRIAITTRTRTGKIIDGLTELHKDILQFIRLNPTVMSGFMNGFALDGELLLENTDGLSTGDLFQATSKALSTTGEKVNIHYNVFDFLPLSDFQNLDASEKVYSYRRENWLNALKPSKFTSVIDVLAVGTKADIVEWSEYATEQGWEGVMMNAANGYYRKTRSPQLLKVKKMHTADLPIVGFNEALSGKFAGTLGSINVQLDEDNIVQVGSGLTEEVRDEIWNNQEKYMGVMIEVQYFEETTNATGGRSLRFPVFKTFRFDKTQDDINIE